jgi:leucyl aminopeptidase (aminopeptidase T)
MKEEITTKESKIIVKEQTEAFFNVLSGDYSELDTEIESIIRVLAEDTALHYLNDNYEVID